MTYSNPRFDFAIDPRQIRVLDVPDSKGGY